MRALTRNKLVARPRQITVLPNRDFTFTMSLQEALPGEETAAETESESKKSANTREINWLLRHKRRSVLEARGQDGGFDQTWTVPAPAPSRLLAAWIPELDGTVEVMATPLGSGGEIDGDNVPSFGVLRLKGRIAGSGRWTLGGLVSESESTAWRMAAEFVAEPVEGHELQIGTGYGTRFVRPLLPTEGRRAPRRPQRRRAVRPGPLGHRRRGHGDRRRALLLHRVPGRRPPPRPVADDRGEAR